MKIIPSDGNNAQTSSLGNTAQNDVQSQLEKKVKIKGWEYFRLKIAFVPCMALFGLKFSLGYYLRVFMNL